MTYHLFARKMRCAHLGGVVMKPKENASQSMCCSLWVWARMHIPGPPPGPTESDLQASKAPR